MNITEKHGVARALWCKDCNPDNCSGCVTLVVPVGMEPVARIEGIDEYGPQLEWNQHWVDAGVGAKLFTESQVQAMLAAARKPIADEVLHALYTDAMSGHYVDALHYWKGTPAHQYARAIENAHGIKSTNQEINK